MWNKVSWNGNTSVCESHLYPYAGGCLLDKIQFFFFTLNQVSAEINDVMLNPEKASLCFICKGFLGFSTAPKRCRFPDLQY